MHASVKHAVTHFKSMRVALKELEPLIRNGAHLRTGRPFKRFGGMRSREILANWLVCAVNNAEAGSERLTFTSDPIGGDGVIYDTGTENTWPTEHVMVPPVRTCVTPDIKVLILKAIEGKQKKGGAAYASGKTLIVFLEAGLKASWSPNQVAKAMPRLDFGSVWVVGLQDVKDGAYTYGVTCLDLAEGNAPVWTVHVSANFETWEVRRLQ